MNTTYRAGFGSAPIAVTAPVFLAGFGDRTQPADRIHDQLEARAVVLEDGSSSVCLVVCDLLGMSPGFMQPARDEICKALGLDPGNVLIACTHTHAGPSAMAGTEALGWANPENFSDAIADACLTAAENARDLTEDADLRFVRAALPPGFAFNRRGLAFEDPWFAALDVVGLNGRLGCIANMHIHPVLLGPHWLAVSTDWIGPFRKALEDEAGGTAVQLTGALGDINPTPPDGNPDDSYAPWASAEQTEAFGEALAGVVAGVLDDAISVVGGIGVVRSEQVELEVADTPIAALLGDRKLPVEFVEWSIGDIRCVAIPGEAFHQLGLEISASRNDRVLLAGLAPTWAGYLPRPFSTDGEGYEEGVSYGEAFVDAVATKLIQAP